MAKNTYKKSSITELAGPLDYYGDILCVMIENSNDEIIHIDINEVLNEHAGEQVAIKLTAEIGV